MYGVWKNVVTLQRQKEIKSLHKESGADRKKDNKFKDWERKKIMMLTMLSLAVEAVAALEAMYICKNANVLIK